MLSPFPPVSDECAAFFRTALHACQPDIAEASTVLDIGCAEYDWCSVAAKTWPQMQVHGIDWRGVKPKATVSQAPIRVQGNAMDPSHYAPETFDWIVSISAIEHMGLGHYASDPKNEAGDSIVMANAFRWLRPGGWMYFDVPWNSGDAAYHVHGTSHRVYDELTVGRRLVGPHDWTVQWRGVVGKHATSQLLTETPRLKGGESFYYLGLWLRKGRGDGTTETN